VAHLSLIDRVAQGDLGAIKYFNAMTGRFREKSAAGVEVNVTNVSGSDMLIRVVEIIQTHVKDAATLQAIADDILALTQTGAGGPAVGVGPSKVTVSQNVIEGTPINYGI